MNIERKVHSNCSEWDQMVQEDPRPKLEKEVERAIKTEKKDAWDLTNEYFGDE